MDEEVYDDENESLTEDESSDKNDAANKSAISSDLIRGHINTIILRTLYERDKYGYEIINEIEEKSHGQYTLKQPTLYSALKRLESQGYIKAYWKTDSVTLGGRRKYFTLTESGKEVAEKNQAEWEYSRTVIDNLISDKSFDFNQPAPTSVDFNILKQSVSRVPNSETESDKEIAEDKREVSTEIQKTSEKTEEQKIISSSREQAEAERKLEEESKVEAEKKAEEERRIVHENFLRLISQPQKEPEKTVDESIVPDSDKIDTEKLIYNNKPETERDYKNLINCIYAKTIKQTPNQPKRPPVSDQTYAQPQRTNTIYDKGVQDGLKVNTSSARDSASRSATGTTYSVGSTLFKCSIVVAAIILIEFVFCLIFKDNMHVSVAYPITLLALGLIQLAVFGVLALNGYKKNSAKPTTHKYVSISIIITFIVILIICVVAFLLNVNFASAGDIMAKIVVPCLTALCIPVFTAMYYVLSRN